MPYDSAVGIAEVRLFTAKIDELQRFYGQDLGLTVDRVGDELTIEAGATRIVFEAVTESDDEPFYHFAFNIPENKLQSARDWQKERSQLIQRAGRDVIHFKHWNAHSVFFNDPAGNIVEYIARHDLKNAAEGDFTQSDILYASKIGLVVDDAAATVATVRAMLGMGIYRDNSDFFASLGNEHALLILVKRNRLWTPDKKRAAVVHPLNAAIRGLKVGTLQLPDLGYEVATRTAKPGD